MSPETQTYRQRVDQLLRAAYQSLDQSLQINRERLRSLELQLSALDPSSILSRGYAVVRANDGSIVSSVANLTMGDTLELAVRDGEVEVEITDLKSEIDDG